MMSRARVWTAAALGITLVASCRAPSGPARSTPQSEPASTRDIENPARFAEGQGRWVMWSAPGRSSGRFVTAEGVGPEWSLKVAGSARWSDDGRWLTSCNADFVAARWMGGVRPSRISVLNGGCESLKWGPHGALALSRTTKRARILSLAPGDRPSLRETTFDVALSKDETTQASEYLEWSPAGEGFLISVWGAGQSWIRWVDATAQPGAVRRLATSEGFEAVGPCRWAPGRNRVACVVSMPPPSEEAPLGPRRGLALFDIETAKTTGRLLFEAPRFALDELSWLDTERLVFRDRDATRVLDVTGAAPPLVLSANASDFAVSPIAPQVAYINHRGLCLRTAGASLGPERLLAPGERLRGVHWSSNGRHLYTHRADLRAVLVVVDVTSAAPRVYQTPEAGSGFLSRAEFSTGGTLLRARASSPKPFDEHPEPLRTWSLPEFVPRRQPPEGFSERWFVESPDDRATIVAPDGQLASLHVALSNGKVLPLGKGSENSGVQWQPGAPIAATEMPAPPRPKDPRLERVALAESDPIALGTVYLSGSLDCSGALIDPYFVVTARHCVENSKHPIVAVLGRGLSWEQQHTIQPYRVVAHPNMRRVEQLDLFENDLAVIELPEPARAPARPFPLARPNEATNGTEIYLAGYGGDWSVGLSIQAELRYGISQLVAAPSGIAGALAWRSPEGAENAGCFGDSGGPVLLRRSDGAFALLAIHFGTGGTDYTKACGRDGVGGNLAAERSWLNESLDQLTLSRRGAGPPRRRPNPF